jgi:hypothetical protein
MPVAALVHGPGGYPFSAGSLTILAAALRENTSKSSGNGERTGLVNDHHRQRH